MSFTIVEILLGKHIGQGKYIKTCIYIVFVVPSETRHNQMLFLLSHNQRSDGQLMELLVKSLDEDGEYFKLTCKVYPNLSISDEKISVLPISYPVINTFLKIS